jgi:hypothetical protein
MVVTTVLAVMLWTQSRGDVPTGSMAFLEAEVDPAVFTDEGHRLDPYSAFDRVHRRIAGESRRWDGWKVSLLDYKKARDQQWKLFGRRDEAKPLGDVKLLDDLAVRIGARYLITYHLVQFSGSRTSGFGARTTGTATVDVLVFDSVSHAFVWQDKVTESSSLPGTKQEIQPRMDQALLNSLRGALEPFVVKGYTKRFDGLQD